MTKHHAENERIKRKYFAYLKEAMRNSEPTVDAAAKALARFEDHTKHKGLLSRSTYPNRRDNSPGRS